MSHTPYGYHGRYLRIDLSSREFRSVPIPPEVLRRFIGGSGLGTWLLLEETSDNEDALGPKAPLAFVFSPLVGSPLTTSAKFAVMAKSPLTGRLNDSLSSSTFAIAGKKTGHDAILVVGAADSPTCLVIDSGRVRFDDADDVWGQDIPQADARLKERLGSSYQIALIGPAGENLVHFAIVSHDGRHAGRGGLGAVMGSKKLKAVAVRGDCVTKFAEPKKLTALSKELSRKSLGPATAKYRELGTVGNLLTFNRLGALPTRNFQSATFAGAAALAPETLADSHQRTRASCAACNIGCEHLFHLPGQDKGVRMEYENLFALGPLCGIADPNVVLEASRACDEWGLDTISAGATIAFAMECAERGLIAADDLRFGNGKALIEMLEAITFRNGLGELLSLGTRAAAEEIGQGADAFAIHVKGLELPGYEPRALQTMALGFAVGSRGADHNRSGAYQVDFSNSVDRFHVGPGSVQPAIDTENQAAILDSLILCKFIRGVFEDERRELAEMLESITGWDMTGDELKRIAQRITTAKKWYNIRQGWTPAEDTLPKRFFDEELPDGSGAGVRLTESVLKSLIAQYNLARGWSQEGWVSEDQLADLEIVPASAPLG